MIMNCPQCDSTMYGYTDTKHDAYICWKCGKFDAKTHISDDFTKLITEDPMIILYLIQTKVLKPIPTGMAL